MDTFIDKLAQRLTAQEMIKANTAADAEELHKVQGQVKQYEAYLDELQNISSAVTAAVSRLEHAGEISGEMVDRLEHASGASAAVIERLEGAIENALQVSGRMEHLQQVSAELADKLEHADVASAASAERIDQVVNAGLDKLERAQINTDGINELVEAGICKIREVQQDNENIQMLLKDSANSQNETISDYVHKENVKVYRNVQAVVVEEAAKHTENLEKISKAGAGKMGLLLGISAVALLASLGSLVFQILAYLHVI